MGMVMLEEQFSLSAVSRATPICPWPKRIGGLHPPSATATYEAWYYWEFGTVYVYPDRIDIEFGKRLCRAAGTTPMEELAKFFNTYPGAVDPMYAADRQVLRYFR